jgi:hypothetical protein
MFGGSFVYRIGGVFFLVVSERAILSCKRLNEGGVVQESDVLVHDALYPNTDRHGLLHERKGADTKKATNTIVGSA